MMVSLVIANKLLSSKVGVSFSEAVRLLDQVTSGNVWSYSISFDIIKDEVSGATGDEETV